MSGIKPIRLKKYAWDPAPLRHFQRTDDSEKNVSTPGKNHLF